MDSYDLFGEDGSGMLEGLADLAGGDTFGQSGSSEISSGPRDAPNQSSFASTYSQPSLQQQESSLQKLASFGSGGATGGGTTGANVTGPAASLPDQYNDAYYRSPRPTAPQQYAPQQYHPETIYGMPEHHPGMAEMGGWQGGSGLRGYPPAQAYRHPNPYEQPKIHQYPQQQATNNMGMPSVGQAPSPYIQSLPHYPQQPQAPQPQQLYPQQPYPGYNQLHGQGVGRINQHLPYHQQMEMSPHQYGHMHGQSHGNMPPHQGHSHQAMPVHQAPGPQASTHQNPVHPTAPHSVPPSLQSMSGHPNQTHQPISGHQNTPTVHSVAMSSQNVHPAANLANHQNPQMAVQGHSIQPHQTMSSHPSQHQSIPTNHPNAQTHSGVSVHTAIHQNPQLAPHPNQNMQTITGMSTASHPVSGQSPLQNMTSHAGQPLSSIHTSQTSHPSAVHGGNSSSNSVQQLGHLPPYSQTSPHQVSSLNFNQHPVQRNMDLNVNTTSQYSIGKLPSGLESNSPQYRAPFPQLSPQMSPRAQMSPRPQPSQMSPRPVMSPAKPPNMSPHPHLQNTLSPRGQNSQTNKNSSPIPPQNTFSQQSTLQALEQMVMPNTISNEHSFQGNKNPASPAVSSRMPMSPQQWNQMRPNVTSIGSSNNEIVIQSSSAPVCNTVSKPIDENDQEVVKEKQDIVFEKKEIFVEQREDITKSLDLDTVADKLNMEIEKSAISLISESSSNTESVNNIGVISLNESNMSTKDPILPEEDASVPRIIQKEPDSAADSEYKDDNKNSESLSSNSYDHQPTLAATPHNIALSSPLQNNSMMQRVTPVQSSVLEGSNNQLPMAPVANITGNLPPHSMNSNIPLNPLPVQNQMTSPHNQLNSSLLPAQMNTNNLLGPVALPQSIAPLPINHQNPYDGNSIITSITLNSRNQLGPIQAASLPNIPPLIHGNITSLYQTPISHHQERAALQQQIQEIFCMAPSSENQEKVRCLQERLNILQQHESTDKCNGGIQCILQNPLYNASMIESPQVSSTTGRGRNRGPAKPRKARPKKADKVVNTISNKDQLPVSEDCVTAGTGLKITSDVTEIDAYDFSLENTVSSEIESSNTKLKKSRPPRKPREKKPKVPKEPKAPKVVKEPKLPRERKRPPKDPNAPRKKGKKKVAQEIDISKEFSELNPTIDENKEINSTVDISDNKMLVDDSAVTDFDDIPVSKIPIKELLEEAEARREKEEVENSKRRSSGGGTKRSRPSSGSSRKSLGKRSIGKKRKRGGIVPESDGEPDDLITTPPPSPQTEGDCDSSKRRSGRHAQRKKYTDDVILRLSDEEYTLINIPKIEKETKPKEIKAVEPKELDIDSKEDIINKPNYVYINTSDEDSMIVQYVLASRIGKRELIPDLPKSPSQVEDNKLDNNDISKVNNQLETLESKGDKLLNENEIKSESGTSLNENSDEKGQGNNDEIKNKKIVTSEDEDNVVQKENSSNINKTTSSNDLKSVPSSNDIQEKLPPVMIDVEEYFVKYRNFSYLHCEWKTEDELYKGDKRIFSKIKRFKQKQAQQLNIFECLDDEPFNPDYVEVERVLDVSEHTDPGSDVPMKHYLVKWKGLQYEDSTWELEDDVDITKIEQFNCFSEIPPKDKWKFKKRPSADQWQQLKESPIYNNGNTLRPYQLEGLNWLLFSWHNNSNCILADEMGLGKTIQSLAFINSVWEYGIRGPFLVIAPLSTIPNWQREFEGWTDMNVVVYHGSQQSKNMIQEYETYYKNEKGNFIKDITKFNVFITTFEIIVTDFQDLKMFNWRVCVIDEAHRLKNRNCKLLEGLRQLHLEHRVLLSGTPLQNNVNELFSLLNFLEPTQFASSDAFLADFGQLKTESEVLKLQALLKPMMLRRLKEDVEKSLAPKEETIIEVELTNIQKKYYRGILERNFSFLEKGTATAANIPNLMNTMMELRKCCIHPYLLNGAEDQIQYDYKQQHGEDYDAYYKALIQSSGKMVLVDKLLPKLKAGGHRVLIFSQMVRCLDILEDYLIYKKYPYERIDGRIRGNLRQEAIDRYSKPDSDRFVFLLCTKAGGLGINLTAADTVIIYDSDWNPQNDLQAQARCHRIGQQKMVKIYRLICCNTYEREMFDKASMKLGLDKAVLQSMNTSQGGKETVSKQLSKKEIEDLLKKGAYGAVMDEDNAGDKFCEEDIEMILARRTQVIQMESEKGSTFSKASFASSGIRTDIDIDDPDFWKKWAKKAEINPMEKKDDEELLITEPRRRTQIKRYGHDDGPMEISDIESSPEMSDEEEEGVSLRSKRRRDKFGKKSRKYPSDDYIPRHEGVGVGEDIIYGNWARSECFKIERGLLTFGWARWEEILEKNQFRRGWTTSHIEDCARIIVLFCLRHYKGDEKIRNFIWDLIEPCENGEVTISRNHSGLHNPVPRGRNAKKKMKLKDGKEAKQSQPQKWEDLNHWSSSDKYDCEAFLESSYKKHLFRHANKVLLRVRMMYYIKHEVIGDFAPRIREGTHASALGMRPPAPLDSPPPRIWWDAACDASLLVGTYLHGYENYLAMRTDSQLCFVDRLGPADDAECSTIKNEDALRKQRGIVEGEGVDDIEIGEDVDPDDEVDGEGETVGSSAVPNMYGNCRQWPSMQDLNTRLRRLITSYQRSYKREELKMQQRAKKQERRERMEQLAREEVSQWRWSRADEESFRRTVASYGVEFDPITKSLRWGRFRALARLDSKSDDALTDYLKAFMAMCKRQCGLVVGESELPVRADLRAEPIGEDRAIATLERIDLLRVLREEIATHPSLDSRLKLCEVDDDTPPWWHPGKHDKFLIIGVCKHGLGDTYHKLFCDPKLPFADCAYNWTENKPRLKQDNKSDSDDNDESLAKALSKDLNSSPSSEERQAGRRSKRNSHNSDDEKGEEETSGSALSELESLARLARVENASELGGTSAQSTLHLTDLPPTHWFSERAIESRLHHIAHTIQNGEWPVPTAVSSQSCEVPSKSSQSNILSNSPESPEKMKQKKSHIAIDVETERAKLHALLSAPAQQPSTSLQSLSDLPSSLTVKAHSIRDQRDECSSDSGSRRSTPAPPQHPAPPPAHQRLSVLPSSPASTSGPVDLSAPLDLSEAHDFSISRRSSASPALPPIKSKLDDTLSKLMKKKNVPEPEQITGKEKKRRKLDEIVLGLSAARGKGLCATPPPAENTRKPPITPSVTLTPAPPPGSEPTLPTQKPFSVTVTSVPSPQYPPKDLTAFLQQSFEQQTSLLKQQKQSTSSSQKRQYEALLAEASKVQDQMRNAYSHESKVNKWLAEQAEDARRRSRASTLSVTPTMPSPADRRLTGDEHVPVIHRLTGKRLSGPKAPLLKHLTQWIAENPLYDMDPKWTESIKESIKLPQEARPPRVPSTASAGSSVGERKKGRPPSDSSAGNMSSSPFSSLSSQNLAGLNPALLSGLTGLGGFDPKTLATTLSNLATFDPKILNTFDPKLLASLSSYDPKTNPLLMPFNAMPNLLGNMSGGNMFANLAGLGLSGFSGMDMGSLGITSEGSSSCGGKGKLRKGNDGQPTSAKSSTSTNSSQFPFLFPNHSLLYPPLGIGGLNPFSMQAGVSSAYDALAQCGMLNGNLSSSTASSTMHSTSHSTARSTSKPSTVRSNPVLPSSSRHQKSPMERQQHAQLQQLLLPHDAYLLESLTKQASAYDAVLKANEKRNREIEKREATDLSKMDKKRSGEQYRMQIPPEFAAVQERLLKSTRGDKRDADISKMLFEQMASGALSASLVSPGQSKKNRDADTKDPYEKLCKTSAEFIAQSLSNEESSRIGMKIIRDELPLEPENLSIQAVEPPEVTSKKTMEDEKSSQSSVSPQTRNEHPSNSGEMDLEDLIAPTTVLRTGGKVVEEDRVSSTPPPTELLNTMTFEDHDRSLSPKNRPTGSLSESSFATSERCNKSETDDADAKHQEANYDDAGSEQTSDDFESSSKRSVKKHRGKKSRDEEPILTGRRELRSSAGRQAAAAAARQAAAAKQEQDA